VAEGTQSFLTRLCYRAGAQSPTEPIAVA